MKKKFSQDHLDQLQKGFKSWNAWREDNPSVRPTLSGIDLSGKDLSNINLRGAILQEARFKNTVLVEANFEDASLERADFSEADLSGATFRNANLVRTRFHWARLFGVNFQNANLEKAKLQWSFLQETNFHAAQLREADLRRANLRNADLHKADLSEADLHMSDIQEANLNGAKLERTILRMSDMSKTNLEQAYMKGADLRHANLAGALLRDTDLRYCTLVETILDGTQLIRCRVYGMSAWSLNTSTAIQSELNISNLKEPAIYVEDLEVAQFLHLMITNKSVRNIIEAATSKIVLILGRFTSRRKAVLDTIRNQLKKLNLIPVLFDFEKPASRDFTETVATIAHLSRYIIADITDPRSIPQELMRIVPNLPSVPVKPILQSNNSEYGMFQDLQRYPWVLDIYRYTSVEQALEDIDTVILKSLEEYLQSHSVRVGSAL